MRYLSGSQLVSASTDNTLRLWDLCGASASAMGGGAGAGPSSSTWVGSSGSLGEPVCSNTFSGHYNERNFVGLSVHPDGYIACGSENNTVYCYYKVGWLYCCELCLAPLSVL